MSEVPCHECGAALRRPLSRVNKHRQFCNRSCLGRWRSRQVGEKAAHWKGGVRKDRQRVLIHAPHHPKAQAHGYVYRYRLVAEKMLGRCLESDEVVHHLDGDESNDEPSNLVVITQSEHASLYDARRPVSGEIPQACGNGHALSRRNLYIYERDGLRKWACVACRREAGRRYESRNPGRKRQHATV